MDWLTGSVDVMECCTKRESSRKVFPAKSDSYFPGQMEKWGSFLKTYREHYRVLWRRRRRRRRWRCRWRDCVAWCDVNLSLVGFALRRQFWFPDESDEYPFPQEVIKMLRLFPYTKRSCQRKINQLFFSFINVRFRVFNLIFKNRILISNF